MLNPAPKPTSSKPRWKRVEQTWGRWLMKHDGPDPRMSGQKWVSSIGRVARTTQARFDLLSLHYAGECKSHEKLPKWLSGLYQPVDSGVAQAVVLVLKGCPEMRIISPERHAELLAAEKGKAKAVSPPNGVVQAHLSADPSWLVNGWLTNTQIAAKQRKAALLIAWEPGMAMHIITAERHAELLGYEREVEERMKREVS
jgi:hypothetical protein